LTALLISSCSEEGHRVDGDQSVVADSAEVSIAAMEKWSRSCILCHVAGEGGAPRIGHPNDWTERVERGVDGMVRNAIEGFNNMPPLGYCMDCEESDFLELTRYMAPNK